MLLKDNISFPLRWLKMKPVVSNLLCQKDITRGDWQQLFWDAHAAILWDEDGYIYLQGNIN